jgi:hypothetical protein
MSDRSRRSIAQKKNIAHTIEKIFASAPTEENARFIATAFVEYQPSLDFLDGFSSGDTAAKFMGILDQKLFNAIMDSKHSKLLDKNFSDSLPLAKLEAWASTKVRAEIVDRAYFYILIRLVTNGAINISLEATINVKSFHKDDQDEKMDSMSEPSTETLLQYVMKYWKHNNDVYTASDLAFRALIETLMFYDDTHTMRMFANVYSSAREVAFEFYANKLDMLKLELESKSKHIDCLEKSSTK